jgi:branched-chain amino acid transport system ATP-binding protein
MWQADYALILESVTQQFGALVAIDNLSMTVPSGERHAVLGANGAGKTTLFNAITGDFPPTEGRIRFFGEEISHLPPQDRIRRGLRRTYQKSLLFAGLSVVDNLYLAVRGVGGGRMSLRRVRADHPHWEAARALAESVALTDVLETKVADLSHGQQRQLEIGMALAGAPRFILFDEPAAGLSPSERRNLVDLLQNLPGGIGYIIIEHDLEIALNVAEKVTLMHNGRILRQGLPQEIENDPEVQAIYLGGGHG